MDFNETRETYRGQIEQTIAFAGQGLDFYTRVKAGYLRDIVGAALPQLPSPRLLDIGCGHGYIHPDLRQAGFEVVGVEVADEVLPLARQANPEVEYRAYDGHRLPFDDASFDVATAICVMHHVPPPQWPAFAREMRRILRPGGIAVVFEHNPWNPATRYVVARSEIDADAVLLPAPKLRRLLQEAGMSQVTSRNILFTPFASGFFRTLDKALGRLPLGAQYYAMGRAL
ncbi:MAG TPA: class I SAM-dependent methyltransferase [Ramlibacter sp.]|uniref:class I SAM-dependent methyltransferase n=1 Tax=Ramlibacter sp. TaxID=1917967 RepID=UPI002ECFD777